MRRTLTLGFLALAVVAGWTASEGAQDRDLKRVTVPDDGPGALKAVKDWLEARGFDCDQREQTLVFRKDGAILNIIPVVGTKELDRLLVNSIYSPKEEFEDSDELTDLAEELNKSQNLLRVFVDKDGDLVASGSMTFYDEFTAHEFDAFLDLYVGVLKRYVLTPKAIKMLK